MIYILSVFSGEKSEIAMRWWLVPDPPLSCPPLSLSLPLQSAGSFTKSSCAASSSCRHLLTQIMMITWSSSGSQQSNTFSFSFDLIHTSLRSSRRIVVFNKSLLQDIHHLTPFNHSQPFILPHKDHLVSHVHDTVITIAINGFRPSRT